MSDPTAEPPMGTPSSKRLSVAMIVRDEAAMIEAAIASVQGVADEIIVVDTGSTDATAALAAAAGATVVHSSWQDDFAAARNVSLAHCQGDWVLILDADERLQADSHPALRRLVQSRAGTVPAAYRLRLFNWTGPDRRSGSEHGVIRLFPRLPGLHFHGRFHEHLRYVDAATSAPGSHPVAVTEAPEVRIDHLGYCRDVVQERGKLARNLTLIELSLREEPDEPRHYYHLGTIHWAADRHREALAALETGARKAERQHPPHAQLALIQTLRIACLVALGNHSQALSLAETCDPLCAAETDYWYAVGHARQAQGERQAAITAFRRALEAERRPGGESVIGVSPWQSWLAIAEAQDALGDPAAGRDARWQALRTNAHLRDAHGDLWARAVLTGDRERAAEAWQRWKTTADPADQAYIAERTMDGLMADGAPDVASNWAWPNLNDLQPGHRLGLLLRLTRMTPTRPAQLALLEAHRQEPGIGPVLGQLYLEIGDWTAYERLCQTLIREGRELGFAHLGQGNVRLRQGDLDGAEAALRQAGDLAPAEPNVWHSLGVIALNRQDVAGAADHFRHAVALRPDHVAANLALVRTSLWLHGRGSLHVPDDCRNHLANAVAAITLLLDQEPSPVAQGALRDLEALVTYVQRWSQERRTDPPFEAPAGADAFLADLTTAWQALSSRIP